MKNFKITICIQTCEVCDIERAIRQLADLGDRPIKRGYRKTNYDDYLFVDFYLNEYRLQDLFHIGRYFGEYKILPF